MAPQDTPLIRRLESSVYTVPTEEPEADGTLEWTDTTMVLVEIGAGEATGLGYTYASAGCAALIRDKLTPLVVGADPMDVPRVWHGMVRAVRNEGRAGTASMAVSAIETALWDLKAKLFDLPLCRLLGMARDAAPIYASGGFTSYPDERLAEQLAGWVHGQGIPRVKMKVGTGGGAEPERDIERVAVARKSIGDGAELLVDANGAYSAKQAIALARPFAGEGVVWFEEPVSSDHVEALRRVREAIDIEVAAGEYGYDVFDFRLLCEGDAVDVLQADVSRCGGITGWFQAAAVAESHGLEISVHCCPTLSVHAACATRNLRHLEYFHDHARIEGMFFEGAPSPRGGDLVPDLSRPGVGVELKRADAERYRRG